MVLKGLTTNTLQRLGVFWKKTEGFQRWALKGDTMGGKRVAVIGGGGAGLATCRCLLEKGHTPHLYEAAAAVGGIWLGAEAANRVLYDNIRTNLQHMVVQFHDLPFQLPTRSYVGAVEMRDYLQHYAETYHINEHVHTKHYVNKVRREGSTWRVQYTHEGKTESADFDAVVVANGHHTAPYTPQLHGVAEWSLKKRNVSVSHASEYRNPQPYVGRVVLIVGARSSGTDIAREVSAVASLVYIYDTDCTQIEQKGNRIRLPADNEGITPEGHPILSNGIIMDGRAITDIIFCTGYAYAFPFLDLPALGMEQSGKGKFITGIDKLVVARKYRSLFFVGLPSVTAPFPLFEPQARFVAAMLDGTADVSDLGERVATSFTLAADQWDYVKDLLRRAKVPNLKQQCRRIDLVRELYMHRVAEYNKSRFPGDPDHYRNVEYTIDWATGEWSVLRPKL